jgi:rod shape-determining protein MreC
MNPTTSRSGHTAALILLIAGLIALALGGYMTPIARFLLNPTITVQAWISTRAQAVQDFITSPTDLSHLRQRVMDLETENARLQTQIIELQEQTAEMTILTALLDFRRSNPENRYSAATVVGRDPSPFMKYINIDRGSDDGLRRGMPVVTHQGLVGRVAAVTAGGARVQLITDPGSRVNVRIQPSDAEAVLVGDITGEVHLDWIPQDANVQPGDLIFTSGFGGNYPPNNLIGQVSAVRTRDYDLFQTATVQPVVDFSKLQIVMVITNFRPVDVAPLIPEQ